MNDALEQQWLTDTFGTFGNLWIGMTDEATEADWQWASGEAAAYTNWAGGQPNNYDDNWGGYDADGAWMAPDGKWADLRINYGTTRGLIELPGGNADADADGLPDVLDPYPADPLNAWDLRAAGTDSTFDAADDVIYRLTLPTAYTGGTSVGLFINSSPLPDGHYRFTANHTLMDLSSNALDGNGNGVGGDLYQQEFTVAIPAGLVLESANNDTPATATALPLTEDPAGSGLLIGRGLGRQEPASAVYYPWQIDWSDPDYWRIEALAGDVLSISVDTPESNANPYVELRNAANQALTSDQDAGPDYDAFISHYTVTESGTYYVVVGRNGNYNYDTTPGNYELHVDLARGIQQETDANYSNDSTGGANALDYNIVSTHKTATIAGTVMAPGDSNVDEDYFNLGGVQAGKTIFLSIRLPESSTLKPVIEVRNASGALVSIAPNPSAGVARVDVTSGDTFYAEVLAIDGQGSRGQYLLDAAIWPTGELEFADLSVTAITNPSTVASGDSMQLMWTVGNFGTATTDAATWYDRVVLSSNDRYGDGDDIFLTSVKHTDALGVGGQYTAEADVQLPVGRSGDFWVFVETDQNHAVSAVLTPVHCSDTSCTRITAATITTARSTPPRPMSPPWSRSPPATMGMGTTTGWTWPTALRRRTTRCR